MHPLAYLGHITNDAYHPDHFINFQNSYEYARSQEL